MSKLALTEYSGIKQWLLKEADTYLAAKRLEAEEKRKEKSI